MDIWYIKLILPMRNLNVYRNGIKTKLYTSGNAKEIVN